MSEKPATRIRSGDLTGNRRRHFDLRAGKSQRDSLLRDLSLLDLHGLRMVGELRPKGRSDIELVAELTAKVVQPCVVTLQPVPSEIKAQIRRHYVADMEMPDAEEAEMPEDDTQEPMPDVIDLEEVMAEALVLALPDYPRAEGVELGEAVYTEAGLKPMTDAELKPFAGLAALKAKLEK